MLADAAAAGPGAPVRHPSPWPLESGLPPLAAARTPLVGVVLRLLEVEGRELVDLCDLVPVPRRAMLAVLDLLRASGLVRHRRRVWSLVAPPEDDLVLRITIEAELVLRRQAEERAEIAAALAPPAPPEVESAPPEEDRAEDDWMPCDWVARAVERLLVEDHALPPVSHGGRLW